MKRLLITLLFCGPIFMFVNAQSDSARIQNSIEQIQKKVNKFESNINSLNKEFKTLDVKNDSLDRKYERLSQQNQRLFGRVDSLSQTLKENRNQLLETSSDLIQQNKRLRQNTDSLKKLYNKNALALEKLQASLAKQNHALTKKINQTKSTANTKISNLDKTLDRNTLYWIMAVAIVGLLALVAFLFLKRRLSKNQSSVTERISNTRKELESEALKLDEKLIQLLETQLKVQGESQNEKSEEDHSLALKVADEIARMQKNIARMEEDTKGIKPLKKGIDRIKDNFAANGYEMPDLLGEEYDERMNVDVINFVTDENLPEGKRLISKIIKPQINHNGELVQRAQVDVAQN